MTDRPAPRPADPFDLPSPIPPPGLPAPAPDPLAEMAITAVLDGFLASLAIDLSWCNTEEKPIEAVFTFPVPFGAVLLEVTAELAGKRLASVAMPRRAAANRYEDAVAGGDTAVLVEEAAPGLHTVNLGNLGPGETARIGFRYAQLLSWQRDTLVLRIPTTIAPRYGRPAMAAHAQPQHSLDLVRRARIEVLARGAAAGMNAGSPTHALDTARTEAGLRIVPQGGALTLDRDLVIAFRAGAFQPMALRGGDGERRLLAACFQPRPPIAASNAAASDASSAAPRGRVLKVLIDCSGSMQGDSIAQARRALAALLRALGPEDHVALLRFGSSVEQWTPGVVAATPATIAALQARIETLNADLGGTEMRAAMMAAFALGWPAGAAPLAELLLITDGASWDMAAMVAAARASRHRVFTIGVGAAAGEALLRGLADATGGACEMVTPREGMEERVLRQLERMDEPRWRWRIDWPEGAHDNWPAQPGSAFAGDSVQVAAWFDRVPEGALRFVLLDESGSEVASQSLDLATIPEAATGANGISDIARIAAHGAIAEAPGEDAVERALRYGLLTRETGLVMVAERADKQEGLPELRQVAHMVAAGWHGMGSVMQAPAAMPVHVPPPSPTPFAAMDRAARFSIADRRPTQAPPPPRRSLFARLFGKRDATATPPPASGDMLANAVARLDRAAIARLDLGWMRAAGVPDDVCRTLAGLRSGALTERDLVLALLHALIAAAPDRFVREPARLLRQAYQQRRTAEPAMLDALAQRITPLLGSDPAFILLSA